VFIDGLLNSPKAMPSSRVDLTAYEKSKYATILFGFYFCHVFTSVIHRVPYVDIQKGVHTDG